jgi:glucan phosphorylase
MANLAIIGSSHVNGVAGIHTEILRSRVFLPFAQLFPEKFLNITNGVTQVRCSWPVAEHIISDFSLIVSAVGFCKPIRSLRLSSRRYFLLSQPPSIAT